MKNIIDLTDYKKNDTAQTRLQTNLSALLKKNQLTLTDLSKATQVPITTIQRICKDPNCNPTLASLIPIAHYFSISIGQLVGQEPLIIDELQITLTAPTTMHSAPMIKWSEILHWELATQSSSLHVPTEIGAPYIFAVKTPEDNWAPFFPNAVLIVDPNAAASHKDHVITHKRNCLQPTLNQLLIHENDYYLKPMNPEFKTVLMDQQYKIIGVIVQVRMNLKSLE